MCNTTKLLPQYVERKSRSEQPSWAHNISLLCPLRARPDVFADGVVRQLEVETELLIGRFCSLVSWPHRRMFLVAVFLAIAEPTCPWICTWSQPGVEGEEAHCCQFHPLLLTTRTIGAKAYINLHKRGVILFLLFKSTMHRDLTCNVQHKSYQSSDHQCNAVS